MIRPAKMTIQLTTAAKLFVTIILFAYITPTHSMTPTATRPDSSQALPNALESWESIIDRFSGKIPVVFLDYDGTLSAIVDDPYQAFMTESMKQGLYKLARTHKVAIVTGRPQDVIKGFVDLTNFHYAVNHGLSMFAPIDKHIATVGADHIASIAVATQTLRQNLAHIDNVRIESKTLNVAVHYRNVLEDKIAEVEKAVDQIVADNGDIFKKTYGKMVFEVSPNCPWNKGDAVNKLFSLMCKDDSNTVKIYIGDDITDEDAFKVVADNGIAILVSPQYRPTRANYIVSSPEEVLQVLNRLSSIPSSMGSAPAV